MAEPRNVRNLNPGNIKKNNITWFGQSRIQDDKTFVVFTEERWGFRAMAKIFQQYKLRGVDTVRNLIDLWAPSSENDSDKYAEYVARKLGVTTGEPIDLGDMVTVIEICMAIAKYEGDFDGHFTREQAIAGIEPLFTAKEKV